MKSAFTIFVIMVFTACSADNLAERSIKAPVADVEQVSKPSENSWLLVSPIIDKHCVACHASDKLGEEITWTSDVDRFLNVLNTPGGTNTAMPPPTSSFFNGFDPDKRNILVRWLKDIKDKGEAKRPDSQIVFSALDSSSEFAGLLTSGYSLTLLSDSSTIFYRNDGSTFKVDLDVGAKSPENKPLESLDYEAYLNLLDDGNLAFDESSIYYFNQKANERGSIVSPEELKTILPSSLVSGRALYELSDKYVTLEFSSSKFNTIRKNSLPENFKSLSLCRSNQNCGFWGIIGDRLYIGISQSENSAIEWKKTKYKIELPTKDVEFNIQASFIVREQLKNEMDYVDIIIDNIYLQSPDTIYVYGDLKKNRPTELTWGYVNFLSKRYCESCHIDDGFDQESTWLSTASNMKSQVFFGSGVTPLMPPPGSPLSSLFSDLDRKYMLDWLQQKISEQNGGAETDAKWELVKTISSETCVSCHVLDSFDLKQTWTADKDTFIEVLKIDESGSYQMPPQNTKILSFDDRNIILDWLENKASSENELELVTPIDGGIKVLYDNKCLTCHTTNRDRVSLSAFQANEWWIDNKTKLVGIFIAKDNPTETHFNVNLSTAEKNNINGLPDKNGNIALVEGELKTLSDQHCVSCHAQATELNWWSDRKSGITSRVNSGDMPRGATLDQETRQRLIQLIE